MVRIERALRIALPARQSAFLWGPRKIGKSTWLQSAFPDSLTFDLLQTDLMLELGRAAVEAGTTALNVTSFRYDVLD